MKSLKTLLILAVVAFGANIAKAENVINWVNPEDFSDVSDSDFPRERDRVRILKNLEKYFMRTLDSEFKEEYSIEVSFTDVDLAGDFEPWRQPTFNDIRIVKRIYPARLKFDYKVTDSAGNVVDEGSESLSDLYQNLPYTFRNDQYPYVKDLFKNWVRRYHIPKNSNTD
jgi:hypothetical protein